LLGILECGLKISPMGVQQHGNAFGSGIYFADAFDKSFSYSRGLGQQVIDSLKLKDRRYMLVCEVAMGKLLKNERYNMQAVGSKS